MIRITFFLLLVPYFSWQHTHKIHHVKCNNTPEEFTSSYRMHQMLPDEISIVEKGKVKKTYSLLQATFTDPRRLEPKDTSSKFLQGLGNTPSHTLSMFNYPESLYDIEVPGRGKLNLAAIDIERDRKRGIPTYNDARRQLQLEPVKTFEELTSDQDELQALKSLYKSVDDVDYMVGRMCDKQRPVGFAFGLVDYHVFTVIASRRLFSDPFFNEKFNDEVYSAVGIQHVKSTDSFRTLLLRHMPELANSIPPNAFLNWNEVSLDGKRSVDFSTSTSTVGVAAGTGAVLFAALIGFIVVRAKQRTRLP